MTAVSTRVAFITGGGSGIGAGAAARLVQRGDRVVIADIDADAGAAMADELGCEFVRCDAGELADVRNALDVTVKRFGGVDTVLLNAGIAGGPRLDEHFNDERYRRIMRVNLDGVAYGIAAAVPLLRERGGDIVVTASLAGLVGVELDPVYAATKHAVVGLVRSLAHAHSSDGIRINALCPGFADTAIIEPIRELLGGTGLPLLRVDEVVDALMAVLGSGQSGECWVVQPGRPSEPYRFGSIPGARGGGFGSMQAGR